MNLTTSESSPRARRTAGVAAVGMVTVALGATLFGRPLAPEMPALLPLLIGSVIVTELMSAYVLFAEFMRSRLIGVALLATAYLLSACVAVPYILSFPGVFTTGGFVAVVRFVDIPGKT